MTTTRRSAAPNPQWVLMYRSGLSRGRIAELTGTSPSTIGYHLRIARAADPELHPAHAAAAPKTTRVTYQGLARMKELIAAVQETGRYPTQYASDLSERTLAAWLKRRRREAHSGTLAPTYREGLSVLPDWEGTPRKVVFQARWQDRLTALTAYRASGQDWPRHQAIAGSEEHELGVWLHRQRFELRRGELAPGKVAALDSAVPGWLTGRKRGTLADEARWQGRLAALASYRAAGQDWPRFKAKAGREEHHLGIWLHAQRIRHRNGKLNAARTQALNATVPGWRTGRLPGRKPTTQSASKTSGLEGNSEPDRAATT